MPKSDDPYTLLGVSRTASADEIRKAYRKLAKELHPDLNPGDKSVEDQFKNVSQAYHLLSDAEQRARFDRGEIDASGQETPQQQYYRHYADSDRGRRYDSSAGFRDFEGTSDIFADLFGHGAEGAGRVHARGQDVLYRLAVPFLDAVNGTKQHLNLPDGSSIELTIPKGSRDGTMLRLRGKGRPGLGEGPPGDALVELSIQPHPYFTRDGDDLVLELPITLDEAALGAKVEVPSATGRLRVTVPKGSTTGDVLRLRGKGVAKAGGGHGDQRVVLKVVMPDEVDKDLAEFLEKWRKTHAYNPRAAL